jgi:hypothetical protein
MPREPEGQARTKTPRREVHVIRRYVAPILRLLAFLGLLASPLLLAAIARAESASAPAPVAREGTRLVALRSVVLSERPDDRAARGGRVAASAPATLAERSGGKVLVTSPGWGGSVGVKGWADASAFFVLDDAGTETEDLIRNARLLLDSRDRPVLASAYLGESVRRDPANAEAWELLGHAGELLAQGARLAEDGRAPSSILVAGLWSVGVVPAGDGKTFRYDGEAYRRAIALAPPADVAERVRVRLLTACGPLTDGRGVFDPGAAARREKDLGEFLASFPASSRRTSLQLERARLLTSLAENAIRTGDAEAFPGYRDAAIESASEVSATATDSARRRSADRIVARLTKSLPKKVVSDKPVVAPGGYKAQFVAKGGATVLVVTRPDGKDAIQPFTVVGADPASLAFDSTGRRLVWDEAPVSGRRRTRLLDLARARVFDPAAAAEPELLNAAGAPGLDTGSTDRYTTSLGFSPDGRLLLVVCEGFTADGIRIPKRHVLCDVEGGKRPVLVDRPFSAPGVVDWARLAQLSERLSG